MTKREQKKTTENTLDRQIDKAWLQLVETMERRMENNGMCAFARNHLA